MTDIATAIDVLNAALTKIGSYRMTVERAKTVRIEQIIATDAAHLIDEGAKISAVLDRGQGPVDEALARLRKVMFETGDGFNLTAGDLNGLPGRAYLSLLAGLPAPVRQDEAVNYADLRTRLQWAMSAIEYVVGRLPG